MRAVTTEVYLLLGTNLGNKAENLDKAIQLIKERVGTVKAISGIYETQAWGKEDQPDFYNQAVLVGTKLSPAETLQQILNIEKELGRVRKEKWGERSIDIDIIFYGDQIINEIDLKIPHPEMQKRKFVLMPLNEIAENFVHPVLNSNICTILAQSTDSLEVKKK
ncbi:2-amino-4-hydroxy-6-hydroxymethyldihydropteridine diphosphokinase [Pedobacter sp.]|uniref:2-amino-4-hydroxy-6- hydroxymethyldihydropteridine diphosphokinase n=1 Tax=Pedobacter sp. TaxID=1411316 RepID=UPI00396C4ACB